jgi:hypothetical protein
MVFNLRTREISQGTYKLVWTLTLIIIIKMINLIRLIIIMYLSITLYNYKLLRVLFSIHVIKASLYIFSHQIFLDFSQN